MLCDKRAILQTLGCLMKSPTLFEEYSLDISDFEVEEYYQIIYSCIYNLFTQGAQIIDCFSIDSYLSAYEKQYEIFEDNHGREYCTNAAEMAELDNFPYYYDRLKKFSLLRYWEKTGVNIKFLYDECVSDPVLQEKERKKLDETSIEEMIAEIEYQLVTEAQVRFSVSNVSHGQLAGKGMKELKESFKKEPEFGLPLQSPDLTTIARGARLGTLFLRSSSSGNGKSRLAMGDLCNLAIPWRYNTDKKKWEFTNLSEPVLFISTELSIEELQTLVQAYVSGVNEDHILNGKYDSGEEEVVDKAIDYIDSSPIYLEVINNFGIQDIVNIMKKYKREYGVRYFCFDYVHTSVKLMTEVSSSTKGMRLREDQILFLFMDTLKNFCVQNQVFILTMTQLNSSYKDSPIKDETMLRGAKNMADRIDLGEISLPPTKGELDEVHKSVMSHMINVPEPNMVHHIYKVRRGKLTRIRVWQKVDLGTCRTTDLFVTSNDYELIPVEGTVVEVEEAIDKHSVSTHDISTEDEDPDKPTTIFDF